MKSLPRPVNSTGFLAALLLFLFLPFVAVSCEKTEGPSGTGTGEATWSGLGMIRDKPALETTGVFADDDAAREERLYRPLRIGTPARVLACCAAAVMLLGAASGLVRRRFGSVMAAASATAGVVALVLTEVFASRRLVSVVRDDFVPWFHYLPEGSGGDLAARSGEVVGARPAFWVSVALLALLGIANVVSRVRAGP